ncbi:hypothetical protein BCR33DRAFT_18783 [Rhizoclosmatium globosum]|uniref:Uncharacterized protein n=1 Tax=Rhizoclosmatium globosum TaxID=329046 RepID=A0A1Y2CQ53_9FUNG|nr:hypothetical protein BCR33DRAFT_18783 [Rhizoclosmatium globosum]|eukprot:ORY49113.1 hypothetical protein BCR33DRAFT_18783 [Rhizoclosmatium globosum]
MNHSSSSTTTTASASNIFCYGCSIAAVHAHKSPFVCRHCVSSTIIAAATSARALSKAAASAELDVTWRLRSVAQSGAATTGAANLNQATDLVTAKCESLRADLDADRVALEALRISILSRREALGKARDKRKGARQGKGEVFKSSRDGDDVSKDVDEGVSWSVSTTARPTLHYNFTIQSFSANFTSYSIRFIYTPI